MAFNKNPLARNTLATPIFKLVFVIAFVFFLIDTPKMPLKAEVASLSQDFSTRQNNAISDIQASVPQIGVVDMVTVVLLHPKLALFNGEYLGFYRLPLGLTPDEWHQRLQALQREAASSSANIASAIEEIDSQITKLEIERCKVLETIQNAPPTQPNLHLASLTNAIEDLRIHRQELEFQREHPELTTTSETRNILTSIQNEILEIIASLAVELRLSAVLNRSLVIHPPPHTTASPIAVSGADFPTLDLYYAFLASHPASNDFTHSPPSQRVARWLDLTRHPNHPIIREIQPYPLVLQGGIDLTLEIIARLFQKYNLSPETLSNLLKILTQRDPRYILIH